MGRNTYLDVEHTGLLWRRPETLLAEGVDLCRNRMSAGTVIFIRIAAAQSKARQAEKE